MADEPYLITNWLIYPFVQLGKWAYYIGKFLGTFVVGIVVAIITLVLCIVTNLPTLWNMFDAAVSLLINMVSGVNALDVSNGFNGAPWALTLSALDTLLPVREVIAGCVAVIGLYCTVIAVKVTVWAVKEIKWLIMLARG